MLPSHPSTTERPDDAARELTLIKQGRRWVFRYAPGGETEVLHTLVDAARSRRSDLDWFDAAVLAHQMGEKMRQRLRTLQHADEHESENT